MKSIEIHQKFSGKTRRSFHCFFLGNLCVVVIVYRPNTLYKNVVESSFKNKKKLPKW